MPKIHSFVAQNCMIVGMDGSATQKGPGLATDLVARALEALGSNHTALNGRLVSKSVCNCLNQPHHRTARFSLPLPSSVSDAAWQPHLQRAYRQLPFDEKINTLAVAASSGSEVNLEVAWGLVQPSVSLTGLNTTTCQDPGAAAVRSGHLHLLPWLVQHGCIKDGCDTLAAASEGCSLSEMQRVWELLGCSGVPYGGFSAYGQRQLAKAAARWAGPGMAKLSWLLSVMADPTTQQHTRDVLEGAAAGAAASGNLPMLQWLCEQQGLKQLLSEEEGLLHPNNEETLCGLVLSSALQHEHVAVVEWLVGEVGCPLPLEPEQQRAREFAWRAAGGAGSGEAVRWLLRREVPVHEEGLVAAAKAGKLETVRFLHTECGLPLSERALGAAAGSRSVLTATWLLQAGCPMGSGAYTEAASAGDAAMLRWLVREARCPWGNGTLSGVIGFWPSDAGGVGRLESIVRELVAAGCPPGGGTDDANSVGRAACKGHLALVRYLREELGVAFAPGTLAWAAAGGCELMIEWLVGAGCVPGEGADLNPYTEAGFCGDVDTMACLRRLGVAWGENVLGFAVGREIPLPSIRWLVEQGAPWDEGMVRYAVREARARGEFEDTVTWFEERLDMRLTEESASTESDVDG